MTCLRACLRATHRQATHRQATHRQVILSEWKGLKDLAWRKEGLIAIGRNAMLMLEKRAA